MSARLGGAVAPWIFGRLMSGVGWRGAFWVLGLVGLAWAVWFRWWFRDTPEEKVTCNLAERQLIRAGPYSWKAVEASAGHRRPPWGRLAGSVSLWALCLAAAGVSFGWYFYPTWQPRFLQDRFGIDFGDSELLTGLPFLCGAAGSVLGGSLSDRLVRATGSRRWGRSALGLVGFLGAGVCVLATGWAFAAWQAVALLCLAFFLSDLALPSLWAATTDIGGRYAGTVAGVMNSAGGLGSILSPILTPRLRTLQFAWPAIFAILALGWLVAGLAWLFIDAGQPITAQGTKGAD
jgi:sugar phosphate permease